MVDFVDESRGKIKAPSRFTNIQLMKDVLRIFSAKLVLEVFGGAGAIWGFSEAVTLRNPHTVWFWRPAALLVGVIFFARWMLQIKDYIDDFEKDSKYQETRSAALSVGLSERSGTVISNTGLSETESLVPKYGSATLT